jgi:NitT/TauT family transport system substrate-binding protein
MFTAAIRTTIVLAALGLMSCGAGAADEPLLLGLPGNPPVFLSLLPYVAAEQGFFTKFGVSVELRPFDTGTVAARAAASGAIDLAVAPTPVLIGMVANGNLPLVGIYGLETPDWLIGSTDPAVKTCKDLFGRQVAVDAFGGARSIALQQMSASCGIKPQNLLQGAVSSNVSATMIAGVSKVGVLHLDDVPAIEQKTGKSLTIVTTMKTIRPTGHYTMFVARKDKLAQNRQRYVRLLAALIDAEAFMRAPENWDRVAEIAAPTGRSPSEAREALKRYLDIEFWPHGSDGLAQKNVEAEIRKQVALGAMRMAKPPTYSKIVDHSVWQEALSLTREH